MSAKPIDITRVREEAAHIVRELGVVIHHCEEVLAHKPSWPAQIDSDLNSAADASRMLTEHATRLELYIEAQAVEAEKAVKGGKS
ncbi:MAG: hypothetical protein V4773_27670 [Verrucomicrobiota bacterium]